jgi:hypothetical protein
MCSAALAVGLGAQTQTSSSPSSASASTRDQKGPVLVTGCLLQADAAGKSAGSTPDATTPRPTSSRASGGGDDFILTEAMIASTGLSGADTATGTAGMTNRFTLDGHKSELRKYVNSQVEVRGRLKSDHEPMPDASPVQGADAAAVSSTAAATPPGAGAAATAPVGAPDNPAGSQPAANAGKVPTLHVDSVRQVATGCSREGR